MPKPEVSDHDTEGWLPCLNCGRYHHGWLAKTLALRNALPLIRAVRPAMVLHGPPDDDPIRLLIEQIEKAIKL